VLALKILIVGVGGLGCPSSLALAEAGVKELGLMDPDKVEWSNLHRQILYSDKDIGKSKVEAAAEFLKKYFPQTQTNLLPEAFGPSNAEKVLGPYDLVIDGLDRLEKKFLLNDWCVKLGKPFVHAGVVKFEGQVLPVLPGQTACLRCLIPKIPPPFALPTCQEAGVLGSFSQAIGYLQAHQALLLAEGKGPFHLWKVDVQRKETRSIVPQRNPDCEACGKGLVDHQKLQVHCAV
jgi:molybdopterin/thiamine biosynthesis adenylyltransferase